MGIWSTLFSSSDTISKTTDAVISGVDKMFYTDEEKADFKMKYTEFFPTLLKSYEPFKIAQRILAIWFSFLFGVSFLVGLGIETYNIYYKWELLSLGVEESKIILLDTSPLLNIVSAFSLATIVLVIVGFYFSGGLAESLFKHKEKK